MASIKQTLNLIRGSRFRVVGISDSSECQCCGKKNLKRTVHIANIESGDEFLFGVDCATRALRQSYQGKTFTASRECVLDKARAASMPVAEQVRRGFGSAAAFELVAA